MRDAKYPLAQRALPGKLCRHGDTDLYRAADVEALLANAPTIQLNKHEAWGWNGQQVTHESDPSHNHTARLLMIEPIVRESEERQLLRKLVDIRHVIDMNQIQSIQESARALLAKEGK